MVLLLQLDVAQVAAGRFLHRHLDVGHLPGLGDEAVQVAMVDGIGNVVRGAGLAGEHDVARPRAELVDADEQFIALHAGHHHVGNHCGQLLAFG